MSDLTAAFRVFDVANIGASSLRSGQPHTLSIRAAGRNFDLTVAPYDIRSSRYYAQNTGTKGETAVEMPGVTTYKGTVTGEANSQVRLTIDAGKVEGYFTSGGERYFIEPAADYSATAKLSEFVVYRAEDAIRDGSFHCGSLLDEKISYGKALANSGRTSSIKMIELATEADMEYVATLGGVTQANNEILGILNMAEGLYSGELNISIRVVFQHSWTTADPYAAANTQIAVSNFQNYWNVNFPYSAVPRDAAHLFSGKTNLQSQGWAWIGVICHAPASAYGMSGYVNWAPAKYLITAHELGHNLGANHVDATQGTDCANTLMNIQLSGGTPLTFCSYSQTEINNYVAANGACITGTSSCPFDFDGDNKTDISIFRPGQGEWWYLKSGTGGNSAAQFGATGDKPTPVDLTGDGKTDMAFFRPSTGFWYVLRSEDFSYYSFPFGASGDVPTPADFDGDGKADAAIFRPSNSTWYINNSGGGTTITTFGVSGDVPVAADYDGDGKADIAIYRPSLGQWWIQRSTAGTMALTFGNSTDKPVQGDYTGDGKADVAFWRPSTGFWYILRSEDGSFYSFPFGANGDVPSPGDYDGDGKFDAAVFRPSSSTWFVNRSTAGVLIQGFGQAGDLPVPNAFVR